MFSLSFPTKAFTWEFDSNRYIIQTKWYKTKWLNHKTSLINHIKESQAIIGKKIYKMSNTFGGIFRTCHNWSDVEPMEIFITWQVETTKCLKRNNKDCFVVVISCVVSIMVKKYITQSTYDTSSCRLNPSKLKGFKTIASANPLVDLAVSKISTATVRSNPYPALAT